MESEFSFDHRYSLRWNEYHTKLISSFQSLQKADDFVDVTIACEGRTFKAHKVVLSACSPYFRKLLKANPCPHPIIILQTIGHQNFENILNFMYHGVVQIEPEQLHDFLKFASALQIQGLADIQYPNNIFNRKASTDSEHQAMTVQMNVNESSDDTISPKPSNKFMNENQRPHNEESNFSSGANPIQNSSPSRDLSNIDKIIDMQQMSSTSGQTHQAPPKIEPIDDLVIDEDCYDGEQIDNRSSLPELPCFSGSMHNPQDPYHSRASNLSDSYQASRKYRPDSNGSESNRCIVCKRNYSSPSNLRAHVLNVHIQTSKTNWFECRVCGKKCKTKHYLINHEMQKHGIRQRGKRPSYLEFVNEDTL